MTANFAIFVYIKITIAQITEGYIFNKDKRQFDWLFHSEKEIIESQQVVDSGYVQ